ncbi:MAG: hypothetical protein HY516_03885 [Candidatus Aenigmarchaeota archaeon]|nr:hypothetical protein [Candidatus Aenigmarchaeota archaeon]
MQASGDSARTNFFYYARRFEPVAFKNGRPKPWAAQLFSEEMGYRFCELQGYLGRAAKSRTVKSPSTGYGERCLSVETGDLWEPVVTGTSMDTVADPGFIGSPLLPETARTYLLATHLGDEAIIRPGKKPVYSPDMELYLVADVEGFCRDVMEIMETGLPDGIIAQRPKRIDIKLDGTGEFDIFYSDGPLVGDVIAVARARFG